jgi:hypothetical protein
VCIWQVPFFLDRDFLDIVQLTTGFFIQILTPFDLVRRRPVSSITTQACYLAAWRFNRSVTHPEAELSDDCFWGSQPPEIIPAEATF